MVFGAIYLLYNLTKPIGKIAVPIAAITFGCLYVGDTYRKHVEAKNECPTAETIREVSRETGEAIKIGGDFFADGIRYGIINGKKLYYFVNKDKAKKQDNNQKQNNLEKIAQQEENKNGN